MNLLFKLITAGTLLAATGILAADVLFDVSTPLERPSLLAITCALAFFAWKLERTERKLFRRAIDNYVQKEALRELEMELRESREKRPRFEYSDSRTNQVVVS